MNGPQAALLPDGMRLHLHHGPIDLIISADGPERDVAFTQATKRFQTILTELVAEVEFLRQAYTGRRFTDPVAQRMARAVEPYAARVFVTPMAAVAGAVADEMLAAMAGNDLAKASVNNGGDIAFLLTEGTISRSIGPAGPIEIHHSDPARGLATSGWQGRSHSLGIADAVTVIADTAAEADVAATLIANAIDLPGHPAIERIPARDLELAPELNDLLVTIGVGPLTHAEIDEALDRGAHFARECLERGLIRGAAISLQGVTRIIDANVSRGRPRVPAAGLS